MSKELRLENFIENRNFISADGHWVGNVHFNVHLESALTITYRDNFT